MHIIGKTDPAPTMTAEEAAAKRVADREQAAYRVNQYLIGRIVNPNAVRRAPEMIDLQIMLDERKQLYEMLIDSQMKQVRTLALVFEAVGVERVEIPPTLVEKLEGCSIRQEVIAETDALVLTLVRPAAKEDAP